MKVDIDSKLVQSFFIAIILSLGVLILIYLLSPVFGALAIALLEAMSRGIPVIASKTGGIPEVIDNGKNGILVDFNSESIAKAIVELYENKKKMTQLGENARNTIKKQFSWDKAADEFMKIYLI